MTPKQRRDVLWSLRMFRKLPVRELVKLTVVVGDGGRWSSPAHRLLQYAIREREGMTDDHTDPATL